MGSVEGRHALPKTEADPGATTLCDVTTQRLHEPLDLGPPDVSASRTFEDREERLTLGRIHENDIIL
jgi:hypothetical protein